MTDQELMDWNQKGFIPGPGETEEHFVSRTRVAFSSIPREHLQWPQERLQELFDFKPESLDVVYSNKNLAIWEGAACWIQDGKVQLQLRDAFRKGSYLGLYRREEILAHEAVHAARVLFEEPENEEFFAYATSPVRWRQVLGPIVGRPWEIWLFLGSLGVGIFWEWGFLVASGLLVLGFGRLIAQHRRRNRAAQTLIERLHDKKRVRAALFRMTDAEIRMLARGQLPKGDASLRWQLIRAAYFSTILA